MKLKSQNKTVMFIKDLSKQMETKNFFCENLLFNLRTPCTVHLAMVGTKMSAPQISTMGEL